MSLFKVKIKCGWNFEYNKFVFILKMEILSESIRNILNEILHSILIVLWHLND